MKIGVVGVGMVGGAISFGFRRIGHEVLQHDIKMQTSIAEVLPASIIFVCVPTPQMVDGSCDTSRVEEIVRSLADLECSSLVVIKSTVTPGTTDRLSRVYQTVNLAFCPEFLRERAAASDFVEGNDVCIVGAYEETAYELVKKAHGSLPKTFVKLKPLEAELTKYFANTFNALRIVFANQFYEVCQAAGANYMAIKNAVTKRHNIGDYYLDCNSQFRAFGGSCLPKDTAAFAQYIKQFSPKHPTLFDHIVEYNERIR